MSDHDHHGGRRRQFDGPPVSVRLPAALHDDLAREAIRRQVDMASVIRERLAQAGFVSQNAAGGRTASE